MDVGLGMRADSGFLLLGTLVDFAEAKVQRYLSSSDISALNSSRLRSIEGSRDHCHLEKMVLLQV